MYLMMDIEISCKGHCDSFSHFLYLVSYTVKVYVKVFKIYKFLNPLINKNYIC